MQLLVKWMVSFAMLLALSLLPPLVQAQTSPSIISGVGQATGLDGASSVSTMASQALFDARTAYDNNNPDSISPSLIIVMQNTGDDGSITQSIRNLYPTVPIVGAGMAWADYTPFSAQTFPANNQEKSLVMMLLGGTAFSNIQSATGVANFNANDNNQALLGGQDLANKLTLESNKNNLLLLMGPMHTPLQEYVVNGLKNVWGDPLPENLKIIGWSGSYWGGQVYYQDELVGNQILGIMLSGDFDWAFRGVYHETNGWNGSGSGTAPNEISNYLGQVFTDLGGPADAYFMVPGHPDRSEFPQIVTQINNLYGEIPLIGQHGGAEIGHLETNSPVTAGTNLFSIVGIKAKQNATPSPSTSPTAVTNTPCQQADINQDGIVDLTDYSLLATNFLSTTPSIPRADINTDGIVDLTDYSLLATQFLQTCTTTNPTPTATVASTPTPTPSVTATPNPTPTASTPTTISNEWHQHAFNAQRTSFTPDEVPTPWRWKWAWNGPNSTGGISTSKINYPGGQYQEGGLGSNAGLPRGVQPVTGASRVYVAGGSRGVFALNIDNGNQLWNQTNVGTANSTVAYDPATQAVFVLSTNGRVYKLQANNGTILAQYDLGSTSTLSLPPALYNDRLFVTSGTKVAALSTTNLQPVWQYTTNSTIETPPGYSAVTDKIVFATQDLYVLAINNSNGSLSWRVKPTVNTYQANQIEYKYGWPVISDANGLVLIKIRLPWDTLFSWNPWATTNQEIRSYLTNNPDEQALFALRLSDGTSPFIMNVGHGGFGDGGYQPMGPQPVIKQLPGGQEVVYTIGRGDNQYDGRWDSKFVEIPLNNSTVPGYSGGEVRFIQYNHIVLTDEQPFVSMAGNHLFGGHWMAGYALNITDRSNSLGSYSNRIKATDLPHITTSASNCGFSTSHYCANGLVQDSDPRTYPAGFYIYYNQGPVYDRYWSEYSTWLVSDNTIFFRSADGAIVALESGSPIAARHTLTTPIAQAVNWLSQALSEAMIGLRSNNPPQAVAESAIDYTQARTYAGQTKTVEGKVEYVFNNGKSVLLGFAYPHQGVFKVQIPKETWSLYGSQLNTQMGRNQAQLYKEGDRLSVTGKIEWYQGDPTIFISNPSQLSVQ